MTGLLERLPADLTQFGVDTGEVEFFTPDGPTAFWDRLRSMVRNARERICLATLYWGTDKLEAQLRGEIRHALQNSPSLRVQLVVDYSRGRRKTANGNTVSFLRELALAFPGRVEVCLHKMPQFDGAAAWLPSPLDECVAVFHFKALVADGEAIITGANLSDEYWHCRQARYITVRNPALVDVLAGVVDATVQHSLRANYAETPPTLTAPDRNPRRVHEAVVDVVGTGAPAPASDTVFVPLFQHPALGLRQEFDVLRALLAFPDGDLVLNTPYPNFPEAYLRALETRVGPASSGSTLFVGPSGNSHSFSTGRGLKALVPGVYLHREREFIARTRAAAAQSGAQLDFRHYDREGWVFHSKGIWFTTQHESATIIGSSSFGERSVSRDFDLSFLVVSRDPDMRRAMAAEVETMLAWADGQQPVDRPGAWVIPLLVPLVKAYL
jgi:CDP-diacylglycerol---glycerol-3-phosphate 3-phosphatidyltransferase